MILQAPLDSSDYVLAAPLVYLRPNGQKITVPAGFKTDLASIPRLFWRILPRDGGKYRAAAVVHDYMVGRVPWSHAATIFSEALRDNGTGDFRRRLMVAAVRLRGVFR